MDQENNSLNQSYDQTSNQSNGQTSNQPNGQMPNQQYGQAPNQTYGQAPNQPYGQTPNQPYGQTPNPNNGKVPGEGLATASLILGIVSFFAFLAGMPGIICAARSKKLGYRSGARTAGMVCSIIGLVCGVLAWGACILFSIGISNIEKIDEPSKREYISEDDIDDLFDDPSEFNGKYVTIEGCLFTDTTEIDGNVYLDVMHDYAHYDDDFMVKYLGDETFHEGEYVRVDGKIVSNSSTGSVYVESGMPYIVSDSVETIDIMEEKYAAISELEPKDASFTENNVIVTINKIEYAHDHTRIFMNVKNNTDDLINIDSYGMKVVQDGKQIDQDIFSEVISLGNYEELGYEVHKKAEISGVVIFPALDPEKPFRLITELYDDDDWEVEFSDCEITVDPSK